MAWVCEINWINNEKCVETKPNSRGWSENLCQVFLKSCQKVI